MLVADILRDGGVQPQQGPPILHQHGSQRQRPARTPSRSGQLPSPPLALPLLQLLIVLRFAIVLKNAVVCVAFYCSPAVHIQTPFQKFSPLFFFKKSSTVLCNLHFLSITFSSIFTCFRIDVPNPFAFLHVLSFYPRFQGLFTNMYLLQSSHSTSLQFDYYGTVLILHAFF